MDFGGLKNLVSAAGLDTRLPGLVNGFLVLLLAYGLAQLSWKLLPETESTVPGPAHERVAQRAVQDRTQSAVGDLVNWHLFGRQARAQARQKKPPAVAPDTRLNLDLRGIVAATDRRKGLAIIQGSKEEAYFLVGQEVFDLATLEEIYPDRVILRRNGRYETLRLPAELLQGVMPADYPRRGATVPAGGRVPAARPTSKDASSR